MKGNTESMLCTKMFKNPKSVGQFLSNLNFFFNNFTLVNFHQDQFESCFGTRLFLSCRILYIVFFSYFDNEITLFWFLKMFVP